MDATETEELEKIRKKAMDEVTSALQALENKFPGITEGAAAALRLPLVLSIRLVQRECQQLALLPGSQQQALS
ncbi:hypothetical protein [Lelliottia amnigena]|uniref:hypothetical protein n=1 Tax=Lelliottia amnigena TaxID=61646 RepID=UPI001F47CAD4